MMRQNQMNQQLQQQPQMQMQHQQQMQKVQMQQQPQMQMQHQQQMQGQQHQMQMQHQQQMQGQQHQIVQQGQVLTPAMQMQMPPQGQMGQMGQPAQMGQVRPPMSAKAGDWYCLGCGDLQFSRNTQCRKCGAVKTPQCQVVEGQAVQPSKVDDALDIAAGTALFPISHLETQWDHDKLRWKVAQYFRQAVKEMD